MQAADRLERAVRLPVHDLGEPVQCRADDVRRRIVDAGIRRRVSIIERAVARGGHRAHALHVLLLVKALDLLAARRARVAQLDAFRQSLFFRFFPERILAVRPERMPVRKAVAPERVAHVKLNFAHHRAPPDFLHYRPRNCLQTLR
jgi:hypothetical protein